MSVSGRERSLSLNGGLRLIATALKLKRSPISGMSS